VTTHIHFDNVLFVTKELLMQLTMETTVSQITIIRDVHGRISLFLEPSREHPIDEVEIENLKQQLAHVLGPYFGGDVWVSCTDDMFLESLERVIKHERVTAPWEEAKGRPLWYVLERHVAKHHWIESLSKTAPPWPITSVDEGQKPAVVTFYSFKGGLGRTTGLAGAAMVLARTGFRVAIVDLDLEAPGLATLFFEDKGSDTGVIDYLIEKPISDAGWSVRESVKTVNDRTVIGDSGEPIRIMPVGSVNKDYLEKLARLDFQNSSNQMKDVLKTLLEELANNYGPLDFILLDSRAGFHDIGGFAMTSLSHAAVLFGNHSRQTWAGLEHVVRLLTHQGEPEPLPVLLVHAMAPGLGDPSASQEQRRFLEKAYDVFLENYFSDSDEETVPNQNDPDAPFAPVLLPWHATLRGDITLWADGDEGMRSAQGFVSVLTDKPYQELAQRLCMLFGKNFK